MADFPPTRASLLLRLRSPQDAAAWEQFVDLYAPLVYGYARKQGLQDADAADLCQEVLCDVAGAVSRLEYDPARGAFHNWLLTVVRHRLWKWQADQRRRPRGSGDSEVRALLGECPAPESVEAAWEAEWRRSAFAWACEQVRRDVTDRTWQAFWRTAVEGQTGKRVAADLGLSVAAVYLARSRVLARLKEWVRSAEQP
ncbi:MAG TPA: sigma-70 family RNA polymerase sigma factor [Gemmataceae bacterium]|nr:sigma-70 family RNA polymerase sigma factor [Gemmataceae bacterium]